MSKSAVGTTMESHAQISDGIVAISEQKLAPEERLIATYAELYRNALNASARSRIERKAATLVNQVRAQRDKHGLLDLFLQEFGLSNEEGVALMCLAEALLRVPDAETIDALIADKLEPADWEAHIGQSSSLFVNASTWALMLTGRVISFDDEIARDTKSFFLRLTNRMGEPIIRKAVTQAMRILGNEFVLGRTIEEAVSRGEDEFGSDALFSFDMLGEAARTQNAADDYYESYLGAIRFLGNARHDKAAGAPNGISVKLSALHPRYEFAERNRVLSEMTDRILSLAQASAENNLGFTIDAEEADRLELSLEIFEKLARQPELKGWGGMGMAVQAYGKRAPHVIAWLGELAGEIGGSFSVRLVKGAYWDTEIKRAQEQGLAAFPVFTRKAHTDMSYLVCAENLLKQPRLYPQFATHNAHTIAAVMHLGQRAQGFEFQRLHGMGELLYECAAKSFDSFPPVRIYAPVGGHEDLLAYLVRRLLENGANNSFVNRFLDEEIPAERVVRDPLVKAMTKGLTHHERISLPPQLFGADRQNSLGLDLNSPAVAHTVVSQLSNQPVGGLVAHSLVGGEERKRDLVDVVNPARRSQIVGQYSNAAVRDVDDSLILARAAQFGWNELGGATRAEVLERAADLLEDRRWHLISLLIREAGKSIPDAVAEVREAADFCRYYAMQARAHFASLVELGGPTGESNELALAGRGIFACISPWNFPLAIFIGQISAALATGNAVVAKPAEQTPLMAAEAVRLLHKAGVPSDVLHLVLGEGAEVGQALVANPQIDGVAFTGSTETAFAINATLAQRSNSIVPFIAETGGQNAMIVDSTALLEQVSDDVIRSAFLSAGQRCSALRVLYVQDDIADRLLKMISGAMDELTIGDPGHLSTDVGPVIDEAARSNLVRHIEHMSASHKLVHACSLPSELEDGLYVAPHMFEIESIADMGGEKFGPILHVVRFDGAQLDQVIDEIHSTGFGLTLGIHTRIESRAEYVFRRAKVGNVYVNRNMVGAVVGVQPFGGMGLSGTGPKAGGPHYLMRFAVEKSLSVNTMAAGGNAELLAEL